MQQRKEPKYAAEEPWGGEHSELASPRTEAVAEKETQAQAEQPKDTAWKNAANAAYGDRKQLENGMWPCIGHNGIHCDGLAKLSAKKMQCKPCMLAQNPLEEHRNGLQRTGPKDVAKLQRRLDQGRLDAANSVTTDQELKYLQATKSVAETLAELGEAGFNHVMPGVPPTNKYQAEGQWWPALLRLARCADHYIIPKQKRKDSSQCGGIEPDIKLDLLPLKGTPDCADPGNATYAKVVSKLLHLCKNDIREASDDIRQQIVHLGELNMEHRGDCIECALAAAMYAHAVENGKTFSNYSELQGGTYAESDLPT